MPSTFKLTQLLIVMLFAMQPAIQPASAALPGGSLQVFPSEVQPQVEFQTQPENPLEFAWTYAYQDDLGNIWIKQVTESEPIQITFRQEEGDRYTGIQWSPDGSKLGYLQNLRQNNTLGSPTILHVFDLETRMEKEYAIDLVQYDWSPDSQQIIYARSFEFIYSYAGGSTTYPKADGVWVLELGSDTTRELIPAAGLPLTEVEVSPSGRYILYQEAIDIISNLWLLKIFDNQSTTEVVELDYQGDCAWSPLDDTLACTEGAGGNYPLDQSLLPCTTVLLSARGEVQERLPVPGSDNCDLSLDWAPDGKSLLINARRYLSPNNLGNASDLYTLETKTRQPLETDPLAGSWTPDSAWIEYSAWSSERADFAFFFRNLQSGEEIPWQWWRPFWQPVVASGAELPQDEPSERLYFLQDGDLYKIEPPGTDLTRLTSGANYTQFEISSRGQYILAVEKLLQTHWQHKLDLLNTTTGKKIEIGEITILRNQFPSLSPDGTKLLYMLSNNPNALPDGTTYVKDLRGDTLLEKPFLMRFAHWGSDSQLYYFRVGQDGESQVTFERYDFNTGSITPIYSFQELNSPEYPFFPDSVYYNHSSTYFVVWSKRIIQTDSGELVFLHLDGEMSPNRHRLYTCRMDNHIGNWSSDGDKFFFSEGQSDPNSRLSYTFILPDGYHTLIVNPPAYLNASLALDGRTMAYVSVHAGMGFYDLNERTYQQVIEDLDPSQLGTAPGDCGGPMPKGFPSASAEPIWSPGGDWLVFTRGTGYYLIDPHTGSHYPPFPEGENFRWLPKGDTAGSTEPPPPAVTDLSVRPVSVVETEPMDRERPVEFSWTVPDTQGKPIQYFDLRHSLQPISEESWDQAEPMGGEIEAVDAGSQQVWNSLGFELAQTTRHYFAIKGRTESSAWSALSNVNLLIDSGFRHHPDGYSFLNYFADESLMRSYYQFTVEDLEKMFPRDQVCEPSIESYCVPTVLGEDFIEKVNNSYPGGVCHGMASTSWYFFQNPDEIITVFPGLDFTGVYSSLLQENMDVTSNIAYYQATSKANAFLDEVSRQSVENEPSDLFLMLRDYLTGVSQEPMVLVFLDEPNNTKSAHVVTPVALSLNSLEGDWWTLHLYDNNLPLSCEGGRYFEFNLEENSWRSSCVKIDGCEKNDTCSGTHALSSANSSMALIPLSLIYQEKQDLPEASLDVRVWSSLRSDLLIINELGQRLGVVAGEFVDEIPGAIVIPEVGSPDGTTSPEYELPADSAYTFTISAHGTQEASLTYFYDKTLLEISAAATASSPIIEVVISTDSQTINISSPEQVEASISCSKIGSEGHTISFEQLTLVPESEIQVTRAEDGQALTISHDGTQELVYDVNVRLSSSSALEYFGLEGQALGNGQANQVVTEGWVKDGRVTLQVDDDGDGDFETEVLLDQVAQVGEEAAAPGKSDAGPGVAVLILAGLVVIAVLTGAVFILRRKRT